MMNRTSTKTRTKEALRGIAATLMLTLAALGTGAARAADPPRAPATIYSSRALAAEAAAALAAGHPGRAVLDYERAALTTHAPEITAGLARAQAAAGLPVLEPILPELVARRLGANAWAWLGMSGLVLGAAGLAALGWGLLRRRGFVIVTVAAASITGLGLLAARRASPAANRAVVVASDAVARIAPFAKAEESFTAREGTEVTIERAHDAYDLVSSSDGEGWVRKDAVETIVPADPHRP